MIAGFVLTAEMAEEFFTRCLWAEAVTEKERIEILEKLAAEKKAVKFVSELSKEEFTDELAKNANVYRVTKKPRGESH